MPSTVAAGMVAMRAAQIHPPLAAAYPDVAMSMVGSTIPSHSLASTSMGIWNWMTKTPNYNIPDQGQARIRQLQLDLQPFATWLVLEQRLGQGVGLGGIEHFTSEQNDPYRLNQLVLHAKPGLVVLRNSVKDMLGRGLGTPGTAGSVELLPESAADQIPKGSTIIQQAGGYIQFRTPDVAGIAPTPTDPNFLRAQKLLGIVHYLFPKANLEFEDGGLLGQFFANVNQVENLITTPISVAARNLGAAVSHSGPVSAGLEGSPLGQALKSGFSTLQQTIGHGRDVDYVTPAEVFRQSQQTGGLAFGGQYAQSFGLRPSDKLYGPISAAANTVADWYLNPLVITGKVAAGLKLARTALYSEEAASRLPKLTEMMFRSGARTPEGLILGTDAGQTMVRRAASLVTKYGEDTASDAIRRVLKLTPEQAKAVAQGGLAAGPEGIATVLIDQVKGLGRTDVEGLLAERSRLVGELGGVGTYNAGQRSLEGIQSLYQTEAGAQGVIDVAAADAARMESRIKLIDAELSAATANPNFTPLRVIPRASGTRKIAQAVDNFLTESGTISPRIAEKLHGAVLEPSSLIGIPGTRVNLSAIFHELPETGPIWNPHAPGAPRGAMDAAGAWAEAFLADAGVNVGDRARLLTKLTSTTSMDDFYRVVVKDMTSAIGDSTQLSETGKQALIKWFKDSYFERPYGLTQEVRTNYAGRDIPTWDHVWTTEDGRPIPSVSTQLAPKFYGPSHDFLLDVDSAWRKMLVKLSGTKKLKDRPALLTLWHGEQKLLDILTRGWRDGILLGRAGAVLLRTAGEESVRAATAGLASATHRPLTWFKFMFGTEARAWDVWLSENPEAALAQFRNIPGATDLASADATAGTILSRRQAIKAFNVHIAGDAADALGYIHNQVWDRVKEGPKIILSAADDPLGVANAVRNDLILNANDLAAKQLARGGVDGLMGWLRTPDGLSYLAENGALIKRGALPPTLAEDGPEIGGISEARLRFWGERNLKWQEGLTHGQSVVNQAILHHGAWLTDDLRSLQEARQTLTESQALRTASDSLLDAGLVKDAEEARREAFARELNAKDVLGGLSISRRDMERIIADPTTQLDLRKRFFIPLESEDFTDWLAGLHGDQAHPYQLPEKIGGVKDDAESMLRASEQRGIRNWLYQKLLSQPDAFLIRKPVYRQFAEQRFGELKELGYADKAAREIAAHWAQDQTRELLYDLSQRTSSQRFFRHLAPFLPAYEEILATWAWKLPSRMYPGIGHAFLATRLNEVVNLLKTLGVDPGKAAEIPLLGSWLTHLLGPDGPTIIPTFKAKDLNLVSQSVFPSLGPIPAAVLASIAKKNPIIRPLAEKLMPFGLDVTFGPASINRAFEGLTHKVPPWEILSQDAQQQMYNSAMIDGIRHAHVELHAEGIDPPLAEDFPDRTAYLDARDDYHTDLVARANHFTQFWFLARGVLSAIFPAPVSMTDADKTSLSNLYSQIQGVTSPADRSTLFQDWLSTHSGGDLYLTPKTIKLTSLPTTSYYNDNQQQFFTDLAAGKRRYLTPEEFTNLGLGLTARRQYEHRLDGEFNAITGGATGAAQAAALLSNWNARGDAMVHWWTNWDRYMAYNTDFAAIWDKANEHGRGQPYSFQLDQLSKFYRTGKELAPFFAVNGTPQADLKSVLSSAGHILATLKAEQESGAPYSAAAAFMDQWFKEVFQPRANKLDALYTEARALRDKQNPLDPAGSVPFSLKMSEIRQYRDNEKPVRIGGVTFPTTDQFLWSNLPTTASFAGEKTQEDQRFEWATLPPEWLTAFQRQKVGYGASEKASTMADAMANYDARLKLYVSQHNISYSSNEYQDLQAKRTADLRQVAAALGPDAVKIWDLSNNAPYVRILSSGLVKGDQTFLKMAGLANYITGVVDNAKYGTKGDTEQYWYGLFYASVENYRKQDPVFDADMQALQDALPTRTGDPGLRNAVYGNIFFDQYIVR